MSLRLLWVIQQDPVSKADGWLERWLSGQEHTALEEELNSVPHTHTGHPSTAWNSTSRRSDVIFWPLQPVALMGTYMHTETHLHIT